jgi:hypothetical protein
MTLLVRWSLLRWKWEDRAAISDNDNGIEGDGIIIVVHPMCSIGLAASHASCTVM